MAYSAWQLHCLLNDLKGFIFQKTGKIVGTIISSVPFFLIHPKSPKYLDELG
jgi:hypothetical protein